MSDSAQLAQRLRHRLVPAVPVPFNSPGKINEEAQRAYAPWMAEQPIAGVAVWAHTGRGLHLSRQQRLRVLQAWREALPARSGKVIVAGVGGSHEHASEYKAYLASALEMARDAVDGGADAVMIHAPAPARLHSQGDGKRREDLILDFHSCIASLKLPLILFYLYEAAGGISYTTAELRQLLAMQEVAGIKIATLDSVMTFQELSELCAQQFPEKLIITGEDRFLGYSLMCGAQAALIGMGAACTGLQHALLDAWFKRRADTFLTLSNQIDRLSQVLFVQPMEGYIQRMLWALVHLGVIKPQAANDPWGPKLSESEFSDIGKVLETISEVNQVSPQRPQSQRRVAKI